MGVPHTSIPALAAHYLQLIRSVQPSGPIHLAGYSFGAVVAFEMSLQLEDKDSLGSLNLLDGSHSYVAAHTIHYKNKIKGDMARAETEAMCAFLNQFMPIDYNKLSEECNSLADHEARLQWTVDQLMATGSFTDSDDLHAAVKSFWWKLKMADEYLPASKLRSPKVQFFKATSPSGLQFCPSREKGGSTQHTRRPRHLHPGKFCNLHCRYLEW